VHPRRNGDQQFVTGLPARFDTATENPRLNAVVIDADADTGRATDIERLSYGLEELKELGVGSVRSAV